MTQEEANSDVTAILGDGGVNKEEFDNYFNTKGESINQKAESLPAQTQETVAPESEKTEVKTEDSTNEDKGEVQATKSKDIEDNYKKMAHEERQRRQEARAELDQFRARYAQLESQFSQMQQQQNQAIQQAQQPKIPGFDEDPLGHLNAKNQMLAEQMQVQRQAWDQQQQFLQHKMGEEAFREDYRQKLVNYQQEHKDVDLTGVYNYLFQYKMGEYQAQGFSPQQANQFVINSELALVAKAYNDGVNPAERLVQLATRLGYKNASMQASTPGTTPVPTQEQQLLQQANEKLDRVEKGISQNKTLGNGTQTNKGGPSLDQILNMSDDDFYKYTKDQNNWWAINQKLMASK